MGKIFVQTSDAVPACAPAGAAQAGTSGELVRRQLEEWCSDQLPQFLVGARAVTRLLHDLNGLTHFTLDLALRELRSVRGSLMLVDRQRVLRIEAARGLPDWVVESTALRAGEGVAGQVLLCRKPLLIETVREAPPELMGAGEYRSDSYLSVPLATERDVLGVLNVTEPMQGRFRQSDLERLVAIVDCLGGVLDRALRYREAEELAIRDDLTGLYNRRYLLEFLDAILERARDENFPVTLVLFDLDHFKRYNDRYGHPAGDQVLREVAALMRWNFRTHDVICRLGGEEFVVVLWDGRGEKPGGASPDDPHHALRYAERLRCATMRHRFRAVGGEGITLSGGLATFPRDATNGEELVERADDALYQAKRNGRNRVYLCGRYLAS